MATQTMQFRPLLIGKEYDTKQWWQKINYAWLLQRIPIVLFASVSSYGVGHLLYLGGLPSPFYQMGGISFDVGFLGVIALADMQLKKDWSSKLIFLGLNFVMSGLAALFNVLSHAGGKYANITAEDITVGVPFAIVGLMFALFYHDIMSKAIDKEIKNAETIQEQEQKEANERKQQEQYEKDHPYVCVCTQRYKSRSGLGKHRKTCMEYQKSLI